MKRIITTIVILAVLCGAGYCAYTFGLLDRFLGQKEELKIDKTANVVTSIKKISEFVSMNYYEEFLLKSKRENKIFSDDEIVIIARGHIRAGFNFSKMSNEDVRASGDTLFLTLPAAEILDATINPSDFEVFIEDGKWLHEEVKAIENKGIKELDARARKAGVLEMAESNGIAQITNMYKAFGFKEVICTIK